MMVCSNIYSRVFIIAGLLFILFANVSAVDNLMALQGNVLQGGANLASGNLTVYIYDNYTGGNLIYNSSSDFNNAISDGKYDIMIGNSSQTLTLEYGKIYFIEMYINTEKLSFNGSTRQIFQSSVGKVNGTFINSQQINATHLAANINLANATGYLFSQLSGNISINQIAGYENLVFSNNSVTFSSGSNVSTGVGGWFKGLFNWIINSSSTSYLLFNGSTLSFNEAQLNATIDSRAGVSGLTSSIANSTYLRHGFSNQTTLSIDNITNFLYNYNQTAPANTYTDSRGFLTSTIGNNTYLKLGGGTLTNTLVISSGGVNVTGDSNFNGGWTSNGLSIIGGDLYAKTVFVYNITSLGVNNLDINGSLLPIDLNNTFDIGNSTWQWRTGYFTSDIFINGISVKQWLYNQTEPSLSQGFLTSTIGNLTYRKLSDTINYQNISNIPTCSGNSRLSFDGTTLTCAVISTYNETYVIWAYNQTSPANTYTDSRGFITSTIGNNTYIQLGNALTNDSSSNLTNLNVSNRFNVIGNATFLDRVGIGTSSPSKPFHVNALPGETYPIYIQATGVQNNTWGLRITSQSSTYGIGVGSFFIIPIDNNADFVISNSSGVPNFIVDNLGGTHSVYVTHGSLGVGLNATTNPTQKLDVRGNINVSNEIYVLNGTAVSTWLYNQTLTSNIFNQHLNTTSNVQFGNITSTGNLTIGLTSRFLGLANFTYDIYLANGTSVLPWLYNQTGAALVISNNSIDLLINSSSSAIGNNTYIKIGNAITNNSNANLTSLFVSGNLGVGALGTGVYQAYFNSTTSSILRLESKTNASYSAIEFVRQRNSSSSVGAAFIRVQSSIDHNQGKLELGASSSAAYNTNPAPAMIRLNSISSAISGGVSFDFLRGSQPNNLSENHLNINLLNNNSVEKTFARISGLITENSSGSENGDFYIATLKVGTVTEVLRITSAGRVGIGTSTPSSTLEVTGDINFTGGNIWASSTEIYRTSGGDLLLGDVNGGSSTGSNVTIRAGGANAITILEDTQRVGIGTINPNTTLHVSTSDLTRPDISANTKFIVSATGTTTTPLEVSFISGNNRPVQINLGDQNDEDIGYLRYNHSENSFAIGVNLSDRLYISGAGKTGIGTATPSQQLEVAGNVNISGNGNNLTIGGAVISWDNTNSRLVIQVTA